MRAESSGCRNERFRARAFPLLPCAFPALRGFAQRRAAQGSTGNARAVKPGTTRAALRAHSAGLCREGARGAEPHREGTQRSAKKKQ